MGSEKMKVLEMIQEGKLTAAEGMDLLKAIEEGNTERNTEEKIHPAISPADRFLRVRVVGEKMLKVNVNVPFSLLRSASKLVVYAMSFVTADKRAEFEKKGLDLQAFDVEEFVRIVEESVDGKIVEVEVTDPQEGKIKVEIYVE